MVNHSFLPQRLIGRAAELERVSQILADDGDFLLVGAPGVGRHALIQAAAQQVGAKVLEVDCLRTTNANRFLRLLADSLTEVFCDAAELALIARWSMDQPLVLEQSLAQRPRLVWQTPAGKEWVVFESLLALPQKLAEWLDCRVVIVLLNFPHIRSWDRAGKWEDYLRQEIQRQSRVSYALVSTVAEAAWTQANTLHVISLMPLDNETMQSWIVPSMAAEGLRFDAESQALDLFLDIVQGHLGDAIALARRIWCDRRLVLNEQNPPLPPLSSSIKPDDPLWVSGCGLIEAHHVHRSMLALVEDLSVTFESLILLLPPSQVRVLESLALDPTDKPQSLEYIQKHQLTRGGGLQGALASLEQKGLVYGAHYRYRVALPFLAFWLKHRLH